MRLPLRRRSLALSAAACALAWSIPAAAQPRLPYDLAEPAPDMPVVYRSEPVVQPLPGAQVAAEQEAEIVAAPLPPPPPLPAPTIEYAPYATPPAPPPAYAPPPHVAAAPYAGPGAYRDYPYAMPAHFDREAWLDACRDRIRGVDREDRAGVIGGLLGAAAGGVIGNRSWDSERLAGTLLGAGIGGIAGIAIGSLIGAAGERRREDECAFYLDRHLAAGYPYPGAGYPHGYTYPGHGFPGYGYGGYALVPVMVAIPQRQVVRETVTEEWVDEPVRTRSVTRQPAPRAPRGDKRIKTIKGN